MEKLYYRRPYIKEFEATVTACEKGTDGGWLVELDQTGFYPEGGGQPSDTGFLDGAAVGEVHERDQQILHHTQRQLTPGKKVLGVINWDRRFCQMQNHSGEHILSGVIHSRFGYENVGFHMGKEEVTIDFNGVLTREEAAQMEREANQVVYANVPVEEFFPDRQQLSVLKYRSKKEIDGRVRIIRIPGGDVCACCGTHVMRTGEIGMIKITGMINYKGGVRISMLCGEMARDDYEKRLCQVSGISVMTSTKPEKIVEAVEKLREDGISKDMEIGRLCRQLWVLKAERYDDSVSPLLVFEEKMGPGDLRQYCNLLLENKKGNPILVCSQKEKVFQYALGSGIKDIRPLGKSLNQSLSGKGGGSEKLMQGSFFAKKEEITEAFNQLRIREGINGT